MSGLTLLRPTPEKLTEGETPPVTRLGLLPYRLHHLRSDPGEPLGGGVAFD